MKAQIQTLIAVSAALLLGASCSNETASNSSANAVPFQALVGMFLPASQLDEPEAGPQLAPGQYSVNSYDSANGGSTSANFCATGAETSEVLMNIQTLSHSQNCMVDQYTRDGGAFELVVYCRTPAGDDRWSTLKGDIAANSARYSVVITGTGLSRGGAAYTSRARRLGDCS